MVSTDKKVNPRSRREREKKREKLGGVEENSLASLCFYYVSECWCFRGDFTCVGSVCDFVCSTFLCVHVLASAVPGLLFSLHTVGIWYTYSPSLNAPPRLFTCANVVVKTPSAAVGRAGLARCTGWHMFRSCGPKSGFVVYRIHYELKTI